MAATAHSDPYSILLRKIGYSVGLEYTAERIKDLTARYLQDRDVNAANWHELVTGSKDEGNWGRDKSAEKHIGDFFCSLRLIQRSSGDVLALENLDALAITFKLLENEEQRNAARDFILLWALLTNDGEIFVNLLLARFEEEQIKDKLTSMIIYKRAHTAEALKRKVGAQRINRLITIERQDKNKGSAGASQSVASLKRTEPLHSTRTGGLGAKEDDGIEFSDDYFRKVPPRRRDWAILLGLWGEQDGLTQRGLVFLDGLRQRGYIDAEDRFTYWPMDYELVRSGFRPDLFGQAPRSLWGCLVDFAESYASLRVKPQSDSDPFAAVELIGEMMEVFRSLQVRKAMLRRELPLTIAYPSAVALSCARREAVLDFPSAIFAEQKGEQRRLALRRSRHTGGALNIKR